MLGLKLIQADKMGSGVTAVMPKLLICNFRIFVEKIGQINYFSDNPFAGKYLLHLCG